MIFATLFGLMLASQPSDELMKWDTLYDLHRYEEAAQLCSKHAQSEDPTVDLESAICLARLAELDEDGPHLQRVFETKGLKAAILSRSSKTDRALYYLDDAIARQPHARVLYITKLDILFGAQRYMRMPKVLETAIDSQQPVIILSDWLPIADALYVKDAHKPAIEYLQILQAEFPKEIDVYSLLAGNFYAQGEMEQAIDVVNAGLDVDPNAPTLLALAAKAHESIGQYVEAAVQYQKLLELDMPEIWQPRLDRARCAYAEMLVTKMDGTAKACGMDLSACDELSFTCDPQP